MKTGKKIIFSSLESYSIIVTLRNYRDLLKTHYNESYKLITNSCNNKLLSYHHSATIGHIEFSHPVCRFISYLIKEMPYSGLYCGIVTSCYLSRIVELSLQVQPSVPHMEIITRLNNVKDVVLFFLDQNKKKADLEVCRLVSIANSALKTLSLDRSLANSLAVSIVKATLLATDESSYKLGHLSIKAVDGRDSCETYIGVLYKLGSFWLPKIENLTSNSYHRLLLFTEPLAIVSNSDHCNVCETALITGIVAANIKVVACQKSIDKKIIFVLRRHNIFAIERLGEESVNALAHLSGAFPISDYDCMNLKELDILTGVISNLRRISINNEDYLLMENNDRKVVTLFVSHRSFDTLDQLKTVIKESIHAIYSVLKCPYFLPEDFDYSLTKQLINYECTDLLMKKMLILFAESIKEASPNASQTELKATPQRNDIYLLKRNSLAQALLTVANVLQVGLYIVES